MELVRWDQVEGVNRIQSRINELFEDMFGRSRAQQSAAAGVWYPPVDILESKDSYLIRAELPGMRNEDLKTEVNEGMLTLSGERKFEEPANGVEYHRVERVAGKFSRSFYLPHIAARLAKSFRFRKMDPIYAIGYRPVISPVSLPFQTG